MDTQRILRQRGIRPSRGLGQNFLVDESVLDRILEASCLTPADIVLEVGPGMGLLTRRLAERIALVVAVELDRRMLPILADTLRGLANARVVQADILQIDPVAELTAALGLGDASSLRYKVVANLPYYITSAALRHLLGARVRPGLLTVMVQREVAERILSAPGELSLLAISVQVFGTPELICPVPSSAFFPQPKVDSALLRIRLHSEPRVPVADQARFFAVVHAGFSQKRKQVHNSLVHALHLPYEVISAALAEAEIAPDRRPQMLSIEEWARLAHALAGWLS